MVEVEGQTQTSSNGIIGNLSVRAEHISFTASPKQPQPNDTMDILPSCTQCGSSSINRNGFRTLKNKDQTQVFVCRDCGYRFSQNYKKCTGQHNYADYALVEEAKKLEPVTETKTVTSDEKDVKGKIIQHHVEMKLDGYKDSTIRLSKSALNTLINRGADLTNSQTVKKVISEQNWSGNRKRNVINAYTKFLEFIGSTWQPPSYEITRKIPFIPTEQEIDDLIAASPNPLAAFLQLLKETAMRRGEAIVIPWKDVDLERRIIMCNYPEKGSNPRIFSDLSGKLLNMLNNLPKENEMLFGTTTQCTLKNQLCRTRKRLAFKLGNPRLNEIHCHTLRHWKATMLYHYKPDILIVAEFLGHKDLENTRLYISLEKNLFKNLPNDQFITRIAHSVEDSCKLIEVGFEFVTGEYHDGGKIFRKRK
jgi:integrase